MLPFTFKKKHLKVVFACFVGGRKIVMSIISVCKSKEEENLMDFRREMKFPVLTFQESVYQQDYYM